MYRLSRNGKCDNCKKCDNAIPGFSYRQQGLLISPNNLKSYESKIGLCIAACKNDAIELEELY